MTTKKRFHRWCAGMPKPDIPDSTTVEVRLPEYTLTGVLGKYNWGKYSPITGWRRATPARKRKPEAEQRELPLTAAPEQAAQPAKSDDGYKYGKDTVIIPGFHAGKQCVAAMLDGRTVPLFSWAISSLVCCGMKELRSQHMCYGANGELSYECRGYPSAPKSWQFVQSEWHPGAIKRMVDVFTVGVLTGTGACVAIFNSSEQNNKMNQRVLYDLLLADPLKRCVALPPTRNAVHNSLLYPMMIYATINLPDSYNPAHGHRNNWGPSNVQIEAPRLSKTGESEYVP